MQIKKKSVRNMKTNTITISASEILELTRHGKVSLLTTDNTIYYLIQEDFE